MQQHKPSVNISIMKFISILNDLAFFFVYTGIKNMVVKLFYSLQGF